MVGSQCNKFRGDKGKVILLLVKDIWVGNALSLSEQGMQHGFKDKAMLAEAQEVGQILDEEQLAFFVDPGVPILKILNDMENQSVHAMQDFEQTPVVDVTDNEITSDSKYILYLFIFAKKPQQEQNNESVTAELERYKERVKTFEQRLNIDLSSREKMIDSQMDDMIKEKLALKEQVDSLEKNLSKQIREKESLL
ncbi:hypothetical protein Tco_1524651 [Tanacetum coccineum]